MKLDKTERFGLPLLSAGQIQKEIWLNEGLLILDTILGGRFDGAERTSPPIDAGIQWYRVGTGATGEWAGHDGDIAMLTGAGWRFVTPPDGLALTDAGDGTSWEFRDGDWERGVERVTEIRVAGDKVIGARQAAVSDPVDGAVVDAEARTSIRAILTALRAHGLIN